MDEENNVEGNSQNQGLVNQQNQSSLAQKVSENVGNRLVSNAKSKAAKQSLQKILGPIFLKLGLALCVFILIIGFAMFLITMPGMAMEKLKQLLTKAGNSIAAFFGADTTTMIEDDEIYETLDYLKQMGYDLKAYGFLTEYVDKDSDGSVTDDDDDGVELDDEGKIKNAKSDYIMMYIMSDNYIYTIKNANIVTHIADGDTFLGALFNMFASRCTFLYKLYNLIYGPILDITGITDSAINTFGKGMLVFYYEKDNKVGIRGNPVNFGSFFPFLTGRADIKVDAQSKTMQIAENSILNSNNPMEFSLDGWIGRYGMPLEFLLSMHLTTLKPDLCVDMITAFPTNVNIYLHEMTGSILPLLILSPTDRFTADDMTDPDSYISVMRALRDAGIQIGYGGDYCPCTYFDENDGNRDLFLDIENNQFVDSDGNVVEEENVCSQLCSTCINMLYNIQNILNRETDTNYKTYQPYIASVTDHWFRDVYYVIDENEDGNIPLVDYDYEFEALYKERWTLYETDENGEFVLYKLDENGEYGERFDGSYEDAENQNIVVAKKAKTIEDYSVLEDDLDWIHNSDHNVWLAYDDSGAPSSTLKPLEVDESELEGGLEPLLGKFFIQMNLMGGIVQKGEAQRKETNSDIKNMFLNKIYFSYDGGAEKAEAITKLRKKVAEKAGKNTWYQPIPNEEDYMNLSTEVNGKTYKVSDCVGKVSRTISNSNDGSDNKSTKTTQELLNVSSMLENIHTADADYIARDFKELIVELGYYTKEELTDTTPRLLEFLVPKIGSYGYPKRSIDKNENEYGTMVHSKGDIHAKNVIMLKNLLENYDESKGEGDGGSGGEDGGYLKIKNILDENKLMAINTDGISKIRGQKNSILTPETIFEDNSNTNITDTVGASDLLKNPEEVSVDEFLKAADTIHKGMEDNGFTYLLGGANQENYEASLNAGKTADCSAYVSWVLQEVGLISKDGKLWTGNGPGTDDQTALYGKFADYVYTKEEAGGLQPGDILLSPDHTQINGEAEGGSFIQYNAGGNDAISSRPYAYDPDFYTHIIRFRFNGDTTKPYTGYNGNEAVVSPVTGILLEYGTYDEGDKDTISGEEYRTNIDYKYNSNGISEEGENPESTSTNVPVDKVGYAKIFVLDNKTFSKFEQSFSGELSSLNGGNSFVTSEGKIIEKESLNEDEIKDWSDAEKTLYGYKEFAELYEKGGIAGNIIYIDGFVCEYPDKDHPTSEEEAQGEEFDFTPNGHNITIENFKRITHGNISSDNTTNSDGDTITEYIKDAEYKLASKKVTERLNSESTVKNDASPTFYSGGTIGLKLNEQSDEVEYEGIFIKEGTVLGRTMTDYELIEDIRGGAYGSYEELRGDTDSSSEPDAEDEAHIIGNYLRILMDDVRRDNVENVEDYMKLNEPDDSLTSQPYVAQPGDDVLLANVMHLEGCVNGWSGRGFDSLTSQYANMAAGYVLLNRALINYGGHGTTIRDQLFAPNQYATATAADVPEILCNDCYANAQICLKFDCNYVKNPRGDTMTRDVLGQSGWDQCADNNPPGRNCFWWIDTNRNGVVETYDSTGGEYWDTFFCYSATYSQYHNEP